MSTADSIVPAVPAFTVPSAPSPDTADHAHHFSDPSSLFPVTAVASTVLLAQAAKHNRQIHMAEMPSFSPFPIPSHPLTAPGTKRRAIVIDASSDEISESSNNETSEKATELPPSVSVLQSTVQLESPLCSELVNPPIVTGHVSVFIFFHSFQTLTTSTRTCVDRALKRGAIHARLCVVRTTNSWSLASSVPNAREFVMALGHSGRGLCLRLCTVVCILSDGAIIYSLNHLICRWTWYDCA